MTENVLELWPEIFAVVSGAIVLGIFAVAFVMPHKPKQLPGSSGHREESEDTGHEEIRADGYIDSFAGVIEEAGGGLPPIVKLALPGVIIWWLVYLILYWNPR